MPIASPALHTQRLYAMSDEVDTLRRAAGLPHECARCTLEYTVDNPTCSSHAEKAQRWACCDECGHLITKYPSSAHNGREIWAHVLGGSTHPARDLVQHCDIDEPAAPKVAPLTDQERDLLDHIAPSLPAHEVDAIRVYILAHDHETRATLRFQLTVMRRTLAAAWRAVTAEWRSRRA